MDLRSPIMTRLGLPSAILLAVGATLCVARAEALRGATPQERREFLKLREQMGYVWFEDDTVSFTRPYSPQTLQVLVAKACAPGGSLPGRVGFFGLVIQVIQFSQAPAADLKKVARPAVAQALQELDGLPQTDRGTARLTAKARRCLWNLDYALARSEIERVEDTGGDPSNAPARAWAGKLEKAALQLAERKERGYLGDLVTWYLRADLATAAAKISQLAKLYRNNWRVLVGQDKLRVLHQLERCDNDDRRAEALIGAAMNPGKSIPLRGWAVRMLSKYPSEEAIKFLFERYKGAGEKGLGRFGLEAQEALKRLKKIPETEHRHTVTH